MVVWPPAEPLTFPLSLDAAELLAQFDLVEPSYLPDGYTREGIAHDPWSHEFIMRYVSMPDKGSILLYQGRGDLFHYPEMSPHVTPVIIGDGDGEFIQGDWMDESSGTPTWDETANVYSLSWQRDDIVFSIQYLGEETDPSRLLNDLLAIARSIQ